MERGTGRTFGVGRMLAAALLVGSAGAVVALAPAAAEEAGFTLTAGSGHVVVMHAQPGCEVLVSGADFQESTTIGASGVGVIDVYLPDGVDLHASTAGAGCPRQAATTVVTNERPPPGQRRTWGDTALGVVAGIGALGVAGGVVVAARRRKV